MAYEEACAAIRPLLEDAEQLLVVTHVGPDGDAIASLTATGVALQQLGKQFTLVCDDGAPARFDYLPLYTKIQKHVDPGEAYDLIIALDCGDMSRMGNAYALLQASPPVINIDHHVTNTRFGDVNVVDSACTSTAELLYHLLPTLGARLTPELATCLLTGVVTDTLGFRIPGVDAGTLRTAGMLMEAGADLGFITQNALLIKPLSTLRLWRAGLNRMRLEEEGVLWTAISEEERAAVGYTGSSSGGLVNMMANIDEAAMSAVLIEEDDKVYVGFRCRPPFNVSELALNLGGGGHPLASGATLEGPLNKVISLVVPMARETIRQQRALLRDVAS
ncbi:MAG: bifunctional oligoribonuclease/PAP phosphatase NrnA [Anaerolineae bacterium]|nr:bifunctional oligoribonuclease/PAP phosphatase NrnA [Anaerolineae bacterium]